MHNALADINYLLIFAASMIALLCLGERDKVAVYIFCFLSALYGIVEGYIPDSLGTVAYLGAALTSRIIIYALSRYIKPTRFIVNIQTLCLCFIAADFVGWVAFMNYMDPAFYTVVCAALYSWMIIIIGGRTNAFRNRAMDSRIISFLSNNNSVNNNSKAHKKEIRN